MAVRRKSRPRRQAALIGSIMVGSSSADAGAVKPGDTGQARKAISSGAFERFRAERTLKPAVEILRLEHHRHAVVKGCIHALAPHTMIVQDSISSPLAGSRQRSHSAGEAENGRAVGGGEEMRLLGALRAGPFVEAARRDDAAAAP